MLKPLALPDRALLLLVTLVFMGGCSLAVDRSRLNELTSRCDGGACSDALTCNPASPSCCQGCWDGVACVSNTNATACGTGGEACQRCAPPTAACMRGKCVAEARLLALTAAGEHTCAADSKRRLWCWGDNSEGQLAVPEAQLLVPEIVAQGEWISAAAGGAERAHTCAIHFQGSLWCWGDNSRGQLGLGLEEPQSSRVREVVQGGGWARVAAGPLSTCAVRDEGTLWCWGAGDDGRLGQGGTMDQTRPAIVGVEADWRDVAVGNGFAYAINRENVLYGWGRNSQSQLGNAAVAGASARPIVIGSNYLRVSAGSAHGCAIRRGNSLWCWGNNTSGEAGFPSSEALIPEPRLLEVDATGQERSWIDVVAGQRHTCAISAENELWCWGANEVGQVGVGRAGVAGVAPTRVAPERRWLRAAAGYRHTCAEAADGTLWCWGDGSVGQTGLNQSLLVPTQLVLERSP